MKQKEPSQEQATTNTTSESYRQKRKQAAESMGLTLCGCYGILYPMADGRLKCGDCFKTF